MVLRLDRQRGDAGVPFFVFNSLPFLHRWRVKFSENLIWGLNIGSLALISAVKILIEMSTEQFDDFLNKCRDTWLLEASILKKGVPILRKIEGVPQQRIAILCEGHQAHNLFIIARSLSLPVADEIRKVLSS